MSCHVLSFGSTAKDEFNLLRPRRAQTRLMLFLLLLVLLPCCQSFLPLLSQIVITMPSRAPIPPNPPHFSLSAQGRLVRMASGVSCAERAHHIFPYPFPSLKPVSQSHRESFLPSCLRAGDWMCHLSRVLASKLLTGRGLDRWWPSSRQALWAKAFSRRGSRERASKGAHMSQQSRGNHLRRYSCPAASSQSSFSSLPPQSLLFLFCFFPESEAKGSLLVF